MSGVVSPSSTAEALEMLRAAMGLPGGRRCHRDGGRGAGALPAGAGAGRPRIGTAARTWVLSAFTAGAGVLRGHGKTARGPG